MLPYILANSSLHDIAVCSASTLATQATWLVLRAVLSKKPGPISASVSSSCAATPATYAFIPASSNAPFPFPCKLLWCHGFHYSGSPGRPREAHYRTACLPASRCARSRLACAGPTIRGNSSRNVGVIFFVLCLPLPYPLLRAVKSTGWRSFPLESLFHANKASRADDDVVDQFDLQQATGLDQLLRDVGVVLRGRRVAAGVVVADDDARAVAGDGGPEDLRHAQHRVVHRSPVAADVAHHLVLAVQQQDAHLLVVQVGHLHHYQVGRVVRRADAVLLLGMQRAESYADLQRRL